MPDPSSQAKEPRRVAVVVVPGVGDDAPGETLGIVTEQLTALPVFGPARVEQLVATGAVNPVAGAPSPTYRTSVAHLEAPSAGVAVDVYELQWSDLSRFPDKLRGFILTAYGLVLGLPGIGVEALRPLAAEAPGPRRRHARTASGALEAVSWMLAVPLLAIHVVALALGVGLTIAILARGHPRLTSAAFIGLGAVLVGLAWWGGGRLRQTGWGVWWRSSPGSIGWYVLHPRTWALTAALLGVGLVLWQLGPSGGNAAVAAGNAMLFVVAYPFRVSWIVVASLVVIGAVAAAALGLRSVVGRARKPETGKAAGTALLSLAVAPLGFAVLSALAFASIGALGFAGIGDRDWRAKESLVSCIDSGDVAGFGRGFLEEARTARADGPTRLGCLDERGRIVLTRVVRPRERFAAALPCLAAAGRITVQVVDPRDPRLTEERGGLPDERQAGGERRLCIGAGGRLLDRFAVPRAPDGLRCLRSARSWETQTCQGLVSDLTREIAAEKKAYPRGRPERDALIQREGRARTLTESPPEWALQVFAQAVRPLGPATVVAGTLAAVVLLGALPFLLTAAWVGFAPRGIRRRRDEGTMLTRVGSILGGRLVAVLLVVTALAGAACVYAAWFVDKLPFDAVGSARAGGLSAVFAAAVLLILRGVATGTAGFGFGRVGGALEFVRRFLDLGHDVVSYLRRAPTVDVNEPRRRVLDRFAALLDQIERGTPDGRRYDAVVLAAHSQGTVLTVAALFGDPRPGVEEPQPDGASAPTQADRSAPGRGPASWSLITFGSPLGSIYRSRFPGRYDWIRDDLDTPGAYAPLTGAWVNLYRAGDYVGRSIFAPPGRWDPSPPGVIRTGSPEIIEGCIGTGSHTGYWRDPAVRDWLLREIARGAGIDPLRLGVSQA